MKYDLDEILLNLIMDYPRINSWWVSIALGVSLSTANRHLRKWQQDGVIMAVNAGAYTSYERYYFFEDSMPEFFYRPEALE